ncbi:MAG: glycoside hydrolase family 31 protein, partial [Victivallales bacterium]|nr:glycoside hydrolase family 31 protein [Victivallales bacterium]
MYFSKDFRTTSCPEDNCFTVGNARFQFITERLLRLEWEENGKFEDRQTLSVVNRDVMPVGFTAEKKNGRIILHNGLLTIEYIPDGGKFSAANLKVSFEMNGQEVVWHPGCNADGNLGGTVRTLDTAYGDCFKQNAGLKEPYCRGVETMRKIDLGKGYISRSGWSLIDDSHSIIIDKIDGRKWVAPRSKNGRQDWYLLCYGHDYKAALRDAAGVFGGQPLPPRYILGYWWSRYWAYSDREIEELVKSFDNMNIPIDVMVLDMDWHLEGWTGYTWDKRYFPNPDEHLAWLHRHGLKVTLNLHPADGVGKHEEQFAAMARALGVDPAKTGRIEFDITDPKYIKEYFRLLHHPEEKRGVDFWWLDWQQGESTAMPGLDTLPWLNQLHWEDMEDRADRKDKRPLIFSRFGGYGAGRYNIGFSGDTYSVWESLAYQPYFTATAANVLFGYWIHDIGGHMPGKIEPELFTRWVQYGIFSPVLRSH